MIILIQIIAAVKNKRDGIDKFKIMIYFLLDIYMTKWMLEWEKSYISEIKRFHTETETIHV